MPVLQRDGVEIFFETKGSGPAILLTHGYSATSKMWAGQLEALSDNHTVIAWDLRGHGQSGSPEDGALYREALTVADIAAILDANGFDKAVIGGLSLGGYMSLAFHAARPERVSGLLIIDCGPGYKRDEPREAWNKQARERGDDIERNGVAALGGGSAGVRHKDVGGLVHAARNMLTQHDARIIESLPNVVVPTLVVAGANDKPFLAATDYMAGKIPGAEKLIIPSAGHVVNMDQPDAFNAGILKFLAANSL